MPIIPGTQSRLGGVILGGKDSARRANAAREARKQRMALEIGRLGVGTVMGAGGTIAGLMNDSANRQAAGLRAGNSLDFQREQALADRGFESEQAGLDRTSRETIARIRSSGSGGLGGAGGIGAPSISPESAALSENNRNEVLSLSQAGRIQDKHAEEIARGGKVVVTLEEYNRVLEEIGQSRDHTPEDKRILSLRWINSTEIATPVSFSDFFPAPLGSEARLDEVGPPVPGALRDQLLRAGGGRALAPGQNNPNPAHGIDPIASPAIDPAEPLIESLRDQLLRAGGGRALAPGQNRLLR